MSFQVLLEAVRGDTIQYFTWKKAKLDMQNNIFPLSCHINNPKPPQIYFLTPLRDPNPQVGKHWPRSSALR